MVDKVRTKELAKQLRPDLLIDGELQLDAAIVDSVAAQKLKRKLLVRQTYIPRFVGKHRI